MKNTNFIETQLVRGNQHIGTQIIGAVETKNIECTGSIFFNGLQDTGANSDAVNTLQISSVDVDGNTKVRFYCPIFARGFRKLKPNIQKAILDRATLIKNFDHKDGLANAQAFGIRVERLPSICGMFVSVIQSEPSNCKNPLMQPIEELSKRKE